MEPLPHFCSICFSPQHQNCAQRSRKGAALLTYLMAIRIFDRVTARFRLRPARIWFHFVENLARNHIDEWLLTREPNQEGTL
jgi:hypothetical protein